MTRSASVSEVYRHYIGTTSASVSEVYRKYIGSASDYIGTTSRTISLVHRTTSALHRHYITGSPERPAIRVIHPEISYIAFYFEHNRISKILRLDQALSSMCTKTKHGTRH